MKILVIGSGGREHALCWAIAASPLCDKLFCAPGNGGIAQVAECIAIDVMDFDRIVAFARERAIEVFSRMKIWDTEDNAGTLVYLLLADRRVEIVADSGHFVPEEAPGVLAGILRDFLDAP